MRIWQADGLEASNDALELNRHVESIGFMGWNQQLTKEGFIRFLEENEDIHPIGRINHYGQIRALGKDETHYFTINPSRDISDIKRQIAGNRIDQLILCDDERKNITVKHFETIRFLKTCFTGAIPEEHSIIFYEY